MHIAPAHGPVTASCFLHALSIDTHSSATHTAMPIEYPPAGEKAVVAKGTAIMLFHFVEHLTA